MGVKNKNAGKPRNYALEGGVHRFGRSKMYHKKAVYKFLKKKTAKKAAPKKPAFVEKKIGGAKNGGTRMVPTKKAVNDYPTVDPEPKGTSKNFFSKHKRSLRSSLAPGAVAILLAGVHKGKRVIVLKQLASGLLLITEHPKRLITRKVIFSNPKRKNTNLQSSARPINKLLTNKLSKPSRNIPTENCLGHILDIHLV